MSIDDYIGTVKLLLTRVTPNSAASWEPKLNPLLDFLLEQKRLMAPIPKSLGDLSDLPDELIRELSVKKTDELEDQILTVMRACDGGEASLDQVLVGLYRKFKVVQTRRFLQNKLYRMSKKELVFAVPGTRASYSLEPQSGSGDPPPMAKKEPHQRPISADIDDEIPF